MPHYEDLSECLEFPPWRITAIGWLDPEHSYVKGTCSSEFVSKLAKLLVRPVQYPFQHFMFGFQRCLFCFNAGKPYSDTVKLGPNQIKIGRRNLFVPGAPNAYVAPSSIIHYILSHEYFPPKEFQEAVVRCPRMGSRAYYREMKRCNAPVWSWWHFLQHVHIRA